MLASTAAAAAPALFAAPLGMARVFLQPCVRTAGDSRSHPSMGHFCQSRSKFFQSTKDGKLYKKLNIFYLGFEQKK
jgi:hypothetical protein